MLPVPTLTASAEAEAGPSTPSLAKRTHAGARQKEMVSATTSELTTADEGDSSPVAKKKQKTASKTKAARN